MGKHSRSHSHRDHDKKRKRRRHGHDKHRKRDSSSSNSGSSSEGEELQWTEKVVDTSSTSQTIENPITEVTNTVTTTTVIENTNENKEGNPISSIIGPSINPTNVINSIFFFYLNNYI